MSIKRFISTKDNTITTAFKYGLSTRGTGSNMGSADVLEVFSIYGQASDSSLEKARILIQFPINEISEERDASPVNLASGSVSFKLKMHNAEHSNTTPTSYKLQISPVLEPVSYTHLTLPTIYSV